MADEETVVVQPKPEDKTLQTAAQVVSGWEQEIETWFNDLRQNLRELDTEVHNKLFAAKEALKAKLTAIL